MCRLFGFRSATESRVHRSLISADNALVQQSDRHPDGWGVAYFVCGAPHVIKSVNSAVSDQLFHRVSGVATSNTVLAHLRKATQGDLSIVDTHPFQYGTWIFAHNGNIADFGRLRAPLLAQIHPDLRRYILGNTDSEVVFYLLLTNMRQRASLESAEYPVGKLAAAIRETVGQVCELAGTLHPDDGGPPDRNYLTFLLSNGKCMAAHQGGKALHMSTYKTRCGERDACPDFTPACETDVGGAPISHLLFSSEPLRGENAWEPMALGELVIADERMIVTRLDEGWTDGDIPRRRSRTFVIR
ncbi:MAG: class II glutamine amidotransferase [Nannocystaceae bacterium]